MANPNAPPPNPDTKEKYLNEGLLPAGTVIPSTTHPGGRSIVLNEEPDIANKVLTAERVIRDWEYVTVARPVDMHERVYEVPTTRTVQTHIPKTQVREVHRTIRKDVPEYVEKHVEIPHTKIIDKYVEVPIVSGTEVKYVPKIEVRERTVKVTKPEIKWVEKVIEVPQIKEIVRYVESDKNTEQVIRYVPKGQAGAIGTYAKTFGHGEPPTVPSSLTERTFHEANAYAHEMYKEINGAAPGIYTPRGTIGLSQVGPSTRRISKAEAASLGLTPADAASLGLLPPSEAAKILGITEQEAASLGVGAFDAALQADATSDAASRAAYLPLSPRLDRMEQLFVPRITQTIEVEKEIPMTVDVPVPFMVPRTVQVPVEVPVLRFRDHFVPVPVRRHVIPRIIFTEKVYSVECTKEKPVLIIEDYHKPVPVDVKIKLKEKDIKIIPIDPAELSQADFHAMWMRVNADLLERVRASGREVELFKLGQEEPIPEDETEEEMEARLKRIEEQKAIDEEQKNKDEEEVKDPTCPDFGPLPLHPGHPLMMTYLQSQWIQNASTVTHNMYTPNFFRMHASALDSILHPQPHQVNITHEQSLQLGPLPAEQMPSPWTNYRHATPAYKKDEPAPPGDDVAEEEYDLTAPEYDLTAPEYDTARKPIPVRRAASYMLCSSCGKSSCNCS